MKFIIKLLSRSAYMRKQILKIMFHVAYVDSDEMARLQYVFTDSTGKKWYKYLAPELLPLKRYEQMQIRLQEIEARISRESLLEFSKTLKRYAEGKDLLKVAMFVGQLEERLNLLYDPELMVRFICGMYIREDQIKTAHVWNQHVENEKYEQVMKDNAEGELQFFFQKTCLMDFVTFSNTSTTESNILLTKEIIQNQMLQARLFDKMVSDASNFSIKQK